MKFIFPNNNSEPYIYIYIYIIYIYVCIYIYIYVYIYYIYPNALAVHPQTNVGKTEKENIVKKMHKLEEPRDEFSVSFQVLLVFNATFCDILLPYIYFYIYIFI